MKHIIKFLEVSLFFLLIITISTSKSNSQETSTVSEKVIEKQEPTIQTCPQFMPPNPETCNNGEWINGGVDEKGCPKPPICTGQTAETQICPSGCVCENGTTICSNYSGQPIQTEIITQESSTCPVNCECSGTIKICSSSSNSSSQTPIEVKPSLVSRTPITIEKSSNGIKINIESTQIHSRESVSVVNSQLMFTSSSGQILIKPITKENLKSIFNADSIDNIDLVQINAKPSYLVESSKQVKILFFFPGLLKTHTTINAVSGLVTEIEEPWWKFLTK